jgi:hypothetical protein
VDGVLCIPVAMVQDMKVMTKNIPGLAPQTLMDKGSKKS